MESKAGACCRAVKKKSMQLAWTRKDNSIFKQALQCISQGCCRSGCSRIPGRVPKKEMWLRVLDEAGDSNSRQS